VSLALGVALPWLELRDIMTMHVGTVFSDTAVSFERVGQNIDNFKGKGQKIDKSGRVPQISENCPNGRYVWGSGVTNILV
jgi:hypothetical protein